MTRTHKYMLCRLALRFARHVVSPLLHQRAAPLEAVYAGVGLLQRYADRKRRGAGMIKPPDFKRSVTALPGMHVRHA